MPSVLDNLQQNARYESDANNAMSRYLARILADDDARTRTIIVRFDADDDTTVGHAVDALETILPYMLDNVLITSWHKDD